MFSRSSRQRHGDAVYLRTMSGTSAARGERLLPADRKRRWGGLLERPRISMVQRALLDAGRVRGLRKVFPPDAASVLEVGCGLGECSRIVRGIYVGVDNSPPRVAFAARRYPQHNFQLADARHLPFLDGHFDLVMLIDTSHHFADEDLWPVLAEMYRVTRRWVLVSDPVRFPNQGVWSRLFYRLDRGACFRTRDQMRDLLTRLPNVQIDREMTFRTFPGLYVHAAFLLRRS